MQEGWFKTGLTMLFLCIAAGSGAAISAIGDGEPVGMPFMIGASVVPGLFALAGAFDWVMDRVRKSGAMMRGLDLMKDRARGYVERMLK